MKLTLDMFMMSVMLGGGQRSSSFIMVTLCKLYTEHGISRKENDRPMNLILGK